MAASLGDLRDEVCALLRPSCLVSRAMFSLFGSGSASGQSGNGLCGIMEGFEWDLVDLKPRVLDVTTNFSSSLTGVASRGCPCHRSRTEVLI